MMRHRAVADVGGYHENHCTADDHMLFNRMIMQGYRLAILPEKLLRYRRSAGQMTQTQSSAQQRDALEARRLYVRWLLDEDVAAPMLEQVGALQVAMGEPPADDIAEALLVTRRIREACLRNCDALGQSEINRRSRGALLYHARRLGSAGRQREARLAWREAWRCGRALTADRRVWRVGARLTLDRLAGVASS
jgi:hypothetical protein